MEIRLAKNFKERVNARFAKFEMVVGVLQNDEHRDPLQAGEGSRKFKGEGPRPQNNNLGTYAGGPVRKPGRSGSVTIAEVSAANRERLGFNYLTEPFKNRTADIIKFSESFFRMASGRASSMKKRCENLLQAIVRNPILRGEYGRQARSTTREKGFYRPMIDTAQLFKAIKASVRIGK